MNLLESGQRNTAPKWEGRKKPGGAKNSGHKKRARLGLGLFSQTDDDEFVRLLCLLEMRYRASSPSISSGSGVGVGADPPVPSRSIESPKSGRRMRTSGVRGMRCDGWDFLIPKTGESKCKADLGRSGLVGYYYSMYRFSWNLSC